MLDSSLILQKIFHFYSIKICFQHNALYRLYFLCESTFCIPQTTPENRRWWKGKRSKGRVRYMNYLYIKCILIRVIIYWYLAMLLCVCVYLCMCVNVYICVYVRVCIHVWMCYYIFEEKRKCLKIYHYDWKVEILIWNKNEWGYIILTRHDFIHFKMQYICHLIWLFCSFQRLCVEKKIDLRYACI